MNHLSEAEQALWRRLSVFADSCSLQAIEAVCTGEDIQQGDVVNLLAQLIDQGLVVAEGQGQEARYRLLETDRPAARAQLAASGKEDRVYARLVAWYTRLAEQVLQEAFGPQRAAWLNRLEQEHANLRGVLGWLVEQGEAEQGLRLVSVLAELWFEERHTSEGRAWLAALLALPQAATRTATRAEALDLAGALALAQDDYVAARALNEEALAIFRELGDRARLGYALLHLGHVVGYGQGDFATARTLYQEALELLRDLEHQEGIAHALAGLASIALEMGDYATAHPLVQESLQRYRELGFVWDMALSLGRAAGVAAGIGHPERALRLAGAATAQQEAIGVSLPPVLRGKYERMREPARKALDAATQAAAWEEGRTMSLEQAVAYALEEPA